MAGVDTTSNALSRVLHLLSEHPDVQAKLRSEVQQAQEHYGEIPFDELMALPYLDAVVRETLRLHAPVPSTLRIATKDDMIPLQEPVTDRNGNTCDHIKWV